MISTEELILRLIVATVLGGLVGVERERLERAAGLRTHALVGVGAALFMIVSAFGFADILGTPGVGLDPSRIAAQVVSGIGFLGAGTIIFQREIVRGLTTAASVWAVAAIGLAAGGGLWLAAILATARPAGLSGTQAHRDPLFPPSAHPPADADRRTAYDLLYAIETAVEAVGLSLERVMVEPGFAPEEDRMSLVQPAPPRDADTLIDSLRQLAGVRQITSVRTLSSDDASNGRSGPALDDPDTHEDGE